jgi:hypothetical protein
MNVEERLVVETAAFESLLPIFDTLPECLFL